MSEKNQDVATGKPFTFERKLSLDGVAIITGVVVVLVWVGELKQSVSQMQSEQAAQAARTEALTVSVEGVKSDVAVLSTVVVERTGKPLK